MEEQFYRTLAQASLTLLGLWWLVAQFKHESWATDPAGRRLAFDASLYFLIPGIIALFAIAATDTDTVWRISFGVAGVLGAVSAVASLRVARGRRGVLRAAPLASLPLYAAIAAVSFAPEETSDLAGLRPLELEAVLISGLLLLGLAVAWLVLSADASAPTPGERR